MVLNTNGNIIIIAKVSDAQFYAQFEDFFVVGPRPESINDISVG